MKLVELRLHPGIIDPAGRIAHHFPKVTAEGHAAEVRAKLAELRK